MNGVATDTSLSLLHRLRDPRDDLAWSRFDARYRGFVIRFLQSQNVPPDIAEDVCQNAMKNVYEVMTTGRFTHNGNVGAFRNWLRKVVSSHLAVSRRKVRHTTFQLLPELANELGQEDSRLTRLWNDEHNRATLAAILDLLEGHIAVEPLAIFRRTFVEGADAESVAAEFGKTRNAIVVTKCKVLKKARELAVRLVE